MRRSAFLCTIVETYLSYMKLVCASTLHPHLEWFQTFCVRLSTYCPENGNQLNQMLYTHPFSQVHWHFAHEISWFYAVSCPMSLHLTFSLISLTETWCRPSILSLSLSLSAVCMLQVWRLLYLNILVQSCTNLFTQVNLLALCDSKHYLYYLVRYPYSQINSSAN